ncbi:hypothetical protein AVEN_40321-1 [Araneus ventricosus]|uniref:Uncharacterized protein n=1 Tax=Araneus ventricosus TaxID=182803 RepID=A0A4Y2W8M4_ARAVE|nr:hypothetical protein AVEN_239972-1 [Araneus ventricosus]GBO32777.1 hypothetical protein AVEN_95662-1 [Araneus ventricosus]GBO32888.1 hypothetical protein AVEN_103333-1 [Araneus ventricosus]GBO32889.1 hypothetical protein AVEN_40321-1 [Araneus ventricosus]
MKIRTDESTDSAMFQLDFPKNKETDLRYPDFVADEYIHGILKKNARRFCLSSCDSPSLLLRWYPISAARILFNVSRLCLNLHRANISLANLRFLEVGSSLSILFTNNT